MKRKADWQKLEDYILQSIKDIDKFAKKSPGSGNKGRKGDITTSCGLHIECKQRNLKDVYKEDWLEKTIEEVPLHSKNVPILICQNKEGKVRVHMDWLDFWSIYKEWCNRD